jgi:drug/metabolite transporter (DMT)-like permease
MSGNLPSTKSGGTSNLAIWAGLIAVYIVWGSTYLAIFFVVQTIPPFLSAGTRFLIAGGVLYGFQRLRGDPAPKRFEWRSAAIVGLLLLLGGNGGVVWAEQRVASGITALLIGSVPLWMAMIDALRPAGQRPNRWVILGVISGFLGIVILVGPAGLIGGEGQVDPVGALVLIMASLSWAIGSLYARGAKLPSSPLLGTGMEMLAGSAGLFIMATISGEWGRLDLAAISTRSWLGMIYLIVFGAWVGFASYTWLLRVAPTTLVSTYAYVNPLVAIFLGAMLAGEEITPRVLFAAAIIIGSVILITMTQPASQGSKVGEEVALSAGDD